MIFDPKKGGHFFDIFDPPLPQKLQKGGFKWGGGVWGGSGPKIHWGMRLLDKMILQGVKLTSQSLGVGYANSPKMAQNGGVCGVFPSLAWL